MARTYDPLWWLAEEQEKYAEEQAKRGYVWDPEKGKWVKATQPGLPDSTTTNNDNDGGGNGGGGGGGGAANPGLSPYIQDYRLNFFPQGNPPANLLQQAKDNNWSIAYWRMQIRMKDPRYWRSNEAKQLLPSFNRTMKILFPGLSDRTKQQQLMKSKFYKQQAMWYLQNGIGLQRGGGADALYAHITQTKRWNKYNPYWKQYARNKFATAESNPLLYKQYLDTVKQSYHALGLTQVPDDYYRTFFKSRYATKEGLRDFGENLKLQYQAGSSMGWFQGRSMDEGQIKTATMNAGQKGEDLRGRLKKSFGVRSSFLSGQQRSFDTSLSKNEKLTNPLL